MAKGIDVYVNSGVHIKGFTKLTKKAREIAKQKLVDEIQNDKCELVWDIYEENAWREDDKE
jgi:hypothetical protein